MPGRPATWNKPTGVEWHRVTMDWPLPLWREVQHLALEENTSAVALAIEAMQKFLESKRKEGKPDKKPKKQS
jgi:hypothetical protein